MCRVREKAGSLSLSAEFFTLDKRPTTAAAVVAVSRSDFSSSGWREEQNKWCRYRLGPNGACCNS